MRSVKIRVVAGPDLTARELYALLQLRAEVFVVEQACVYLDPDGHDLEPTTTHLWVPGPGSHVAAALRVQPARLGAGWRIGRVVTAPTHRNRRFAAALLTAALDRFDPPVELDAQSRLVDWYEHFGFEVAGAEFIEDGIAHVPMALR